MTFDQKVLKFFQPCATFFSTTTWRSFRSLFNHGLYWKLKEEDHSLLREKLAGGYYLILVGGHPTLSGILIKLATFIKTRKWPVYTHILMNVDACEIANESQHFKLVEAVGVYGVRYASFMQVFDCDNVALLRPKGYTDELWEQALMNVKEDIGKPYDALFDLLDDSEMSCVELVRDALKKDNREYEKLFPEFEKSIAEKKNLTPQMYRDCPEFEVVLEIRR
jgi:hypothetical protein